MTITSFTLGCAPGSHIAIEALLFDIEAVRSNVSNVDQARHDGPRVHVKGLSDVQLKELSVRVLSALETVGQPTVGGVKVTLGRGSLAGYSITPTRAMAPVIDLPIAFALLHGHESWDVLPSLAIAGELGLAGDVRAIRGVFAFVRAARAAGIRAVIVPMGNANEAYAAAGGEIDVFAVRHLSDLSDLRQLARHKISLIPNFEGQRFGPESDFSEVRGHNAAIAKIAAAIADRQDIVLVGPPGTGKHMLAGRIPSILKPPTRPQSEHLTKIYSALGINRDMVITDRPFRAPHHSISTAALLGAASIDAGICIPGASLVGRPGEIHLASYGVMLLDEISEFRTEALLALRHALDRMGDARPLIVATGDPGFGPGRSASLERALATIGVAGERIAVDHVPMAEMRTAPAGEPSSAIRARLWGAS